MDSSSIPTGKKSKEIVMTSDGEKAHVVSEGLSELTPLILTTQTLKFTIPTEFLSSSLVITSDQQMTIHLLNLQEIWI